MNPCFGNEFSSRTSSKSRATPWAGTNERGASQLFLQREGVERRVDHNGITLPRTLHWEGETSIDIRAKDAQRGCRKISLHYSEEDANGRHRLLRMREPHAQTEWSGPWSDGSSEWTQRMRAKLGQTDRKDGMFWISLEDMSRNFR